jgi:hypothetical protein
MMGTCSNRLTDARPSRHPIADPLRKYRRFGQSHEQFSMADLEGEYDFRGFLHHPDKAAEY